MKQVLSNASQKRRISVDLPEEPADTQSMRSLRVKDLIIKMQLALILFLLLAALMLQYKVNRMCVTDPPLLCRVDL
jgi:hypothetical protein